MLYRIIISIEPQFLWKRSNRVPVIKEKHIGKLFSYKLFSQICFVAINVTTRFNLSTNHGLYRTPRKMYLRVLQSRSTVCCIHSTLIKPNRNLFPSKSESFAGFSVFFLKKSRHFFRCFSGLILMINSLPAILLSTAGTKNLLDLPCSYRAEKESVRWHFCLCHRNISHLLRHKRK